MSNSKKTFTEQQVVVTGSAYPLGATLTMPNSNQKSPAILVIPGTGTSDRDGKNKRFDLRLYKELAEFLGSLGFVVLRYDKRGIGESGGDYYQTGFRDLVDDAQACVEFLRDRPEVDADQLTLLGHSEGCWIAPAVNARTRVQGLILLAGACESARATLPRQTAMALEALEQLQGFRGWLVRRLRVAEKQRAQSDKVMKKILASSQPVRRILGKKINARWFQESYDHDVQDDLADVTCAVLAVTGSKDLQVLPEHAQKFAELIGGDSEWHIIRDMTHILRRTDENATILSLMKLYKKLSSEPIDAELLSVIEDWLQKHFGRGEVELVL